MKNKYNWFLGGHIHKKTYFHVLHSTELKSAEVEVLHLHNAFAQTQVELKVKSCFKDESLQT